MAIAVFGDIHGNLEALEAILKHIKRNKQIKQVYFLGDAITFGPDSSACLKLLKTAKVHCILGNHEQRVVKYDESATTRTYADKEHVEYIFNSLDKDDTDFIRTFPLERKINYKGFKICFTHYSHDAKGKIREEHDDFSEQNMRKLFAYTDCNVVFFGHLHSRKIIIDEERNSYILNGSSGCVKGNKTFYTYFDINYSFGDDPNFDIYRVDIKFNRRKFEEKLKSTPLPYKEKYSPYCFGVEIKE
jgi:predicted phosphodiesterase